MKDLYTFDKCEASAKETYQQITNAYNNIFTKIGVPFLKGKNFQI